MFSSCFGGGRKQVSESESDTEKSGESDNEADKQEKRIEQAREVFKERMKDLDKLFKNNHKLLDAKLKPVSAVKGDGPVFGPDSDDNQAAGVENIVFAHSISSYPRRSNTKDTAGPKERLGDPICDHYGFELVGDGLCFVTIADGCNWGVKPLEAAQIACATFHSSAKKKAHKFTTVRATGRLLLKCFAEAHTTILEAPLKRGVNDIWETGTTTLLGGALLELDDEDAKKHNASWIFICASVGDGKAFHCSALDGSVTDITVGTRPPSAITNVNDPGGRLGPYVGKEGSADLRNLSVFTVPCHKDDIILVLSDGVYDNFDPQQLGVSTEDVNLSAPSWEEAGAEEAERAKDQYRNRMIAQKLKELANDNDDDRASKGKKKGKQKKSENESDGDSDGGGRREKRVRLDKVPLDELTHGLLKHSKQVTKYSRKWMEEHPNARMPDARSAKRDPSMLGKMDHTTCIALRVGWAL